MGILTYLRRFAPESILLNYALLSHAAWHNARATVLLRFLVEFALHWFSLRQGVHSNRSQIIDVLWWMALPLFIATGKALYTTLSTDTSYILLSMLPSVRSMWHLACCLSLRGNSGRDVGQDHGLEQFNHGAKTGTPPNALKSNLDPYIEQLNGLRELKPILFASLGIKADAQDERATQKEN